MPLPTMKLTTNLQIFYNHLTTWEAIPLITNNHALFKLCGKKKLAKWLIKLNVALKVN